MSVDTTERIATMPNAGRMASRARIGAWLREVKNGIVAVLYFLAAHAYDGVCYALSNLYGYGQALAIMSALLFGVSTILVMLHGLVNRHFDWDILGLAGLNELQNTRDIPSHRIFKRLTRWTLRKGHWWIFAIGSILLGPPIITPLLREKGNSKSAFFYLAGGTLVSVFFWVTIWSGVGLLTWNQYVLPICRKIF